MANAADCEDNSFSDHTIAAGVDPYSPAPVRKSAKYEMALRSPLHRNSEQKIREIKYDPIMIFLSPDFNEMVPTASPPTAVPSNISMTALAIEMLSKPWDESNRGRYITNAQ